MLMIILPHHHVSAGLGSGAHALLEEHVLSWLCGYPGTLQELCLPLTCRLLQSELLLLSQGCLGRVMLRQVLEDTV